jgi:hypothetical protein
MYWLICKYSISEKIVKTTVTQESGTAFAFPMQLLYQNSEIIRVFHIEKSFPDWYQEGWGRWPFAGTL